MVKKLNIEINKERNSHVFGINTILKDYQVCFLINEFFSIETHLLNTEKLASEISLFGDVVDDQKVILIQNKPNFFPKLDAFEYIVIINNLTETVDDIVNRFEKNDEILYVSNIKQKYISTKGEVLVNQLLSIL